MSTRSVILVRISAAALCAVSCVSSANAAEAGTISQHSCPYSCALQGLSKSECRDWRIGDTCYVEDLRSAPTAAWVLCVRTGSDSVKVRRRCNAARGETALSLTTLKGEKGDTGAAGERGETGPPGAQGAVGATGATGPTGSTGAQGADGTLRVYGDGSAGARTFSSSTVLNDSNPQYTDFTVQSGVTLTVSSGTVIRCTGAFQNDGSIVVLPALRDQPRFGENGQPLNVPYSGGVEALGGAGGSALAAGVSKGLLRLGLMGGGSGYREPGETGGDGGGNFTVIALGPISNSGSITANGSNAAIQSRGGGGGGYVVLASAVSASNSGTIHANGANGGALRATDPSSTGAGPGGGGGGGVVHIIAPVIGSVGTIAIAGGTGGAAGGAGSISAPVYVGGGGGGGSGGDGGAGGAVNPGNIGNDSTSAGVAGSAGQSIQTIADPVALF